MLTTPLAISRTATASSSQSLTFHQKTFLGGSVFNRKRVYMHTRKQVGSNIDMATQSPGGAEPLRFRGNIIITFHLPFVRMASSTSHN